MFLPSNRQIVKFNIKNGYHTRKYKHKILQSIKLVVSTLEYLNLFVHFFDNINFSQPSIFAMFKYRLCDFYNRGNGEVIRMILHYIGENFDDHRIFQEEWLVYKHSMTFLFLLSFAFLETPFQQLPVLGIGNGKYLSQTFAIARYLAKKYSN